MVKLSMSTDITIGSSWEGSIPLKSLSVNVMGGILGRMATEFTWWTTRRCFFRALFELPLSANPPTIVLMTSRPPPRSSLGGSSLLPHRSWRRSSSRGPGGVRSLLLGVPSLPGERLVVRLLRTKRHRCPAWINSSILSFRAWHSSVEWPVFL